MYEPAVRRKKSGMPIVGREEIDIIGERLVAEFEPQALVSPREIDIDLFLQDYLGMDQDFQYLSHCGLYLGMTVFRDTDRIPVYDPRGGCAVYISAKARTVIIDRSLLEENQEHRYRFTLGHEAGHAVLHGEYFARRRTAGGGAAGSFPAPLIQCRTDAGKMAPRQPGRWTDHDWMEWQANALSSAVLMPAPMVRAVALEARKEAPDGMFYKDRVIAQAATVFNVSFEAACNRLKQLGHIPRDATFSSYILGLIAAQV